jgi:hypothetical protein
MTHKEGIIRPITKEELTAAVREHEHLTTTNGDKITIVDGQLRFTFKSGNEEPLVADYWIGKPLLLPADKSQTEEHTGGSSSYYDVTINGHTISCLDIIEALDMDFTLGNIFKAAWRIAASRNGKKKKGNNECYDAEKIVFFGERLLKKEKPSL